MSVAASPSSSSPRPGELGEQPVASSDGTATNASAGSGQTHGAEPPRGDAPVTSDSARTTYDQASRLRQIVANFHQDMVTSFGTPAPSEGVVHIPAAPSIQRSTAAPSRLGATTAPGHGGLGVLAASEPRLRLRKVPIVAITSGKGGVGKTSMSVNLAALLARRHLRVTLMDADLGLANADVLCGLAPTRRLESVLTLGEGRRTMAQLAMDAPGGFKLVPGAAGLARMANLPPAERAALLDAILDLEDSNDIILIDTGAGLSESVLSFARYADIACVVVTPEPTSLADAYATIKQLRMPSRQPQLHTAQVPVTRIGVLVNQAADEAEAKSTYERLRATSARFLQSEPTLVGWVRRDPSIPASIRARGPAAIRQPDAMAVHDLRTVAEHIAKLAGIRLVEQAAPTLTGPKGWWAKLLGRD